MSHKTLKLLLLALVGALYSSSIEAQYQQHSSSLLFQGKKPAQTHHFSIGGVSVEDDKKFTKIRERLNKDDLEEIHDDIMQIQGRVSQNLARIALVKHLLKRNRPDEAVAYLNHPDVITIPNYMPYFTSKMARLLFENGYTEKSLKIFHRVSQANFQKKYKEMFLEKYTVSYEFFLNPNLGVINQQLLMAISTLDEKESDNMLKLAIGLFAEYQNFNQAFRLITVVSDPELKMNLKEDLTQKLTKLPKHKRERQMKTLGDPYMIQTMLLNDIQSEIDKGKISKAIKQIQKIKTDPLRNKAINRLIQYYIAKKDKKAAKKWVDEIKGDLELQKKLIRIIKLI